MATETNIKKCAMCGTNVSHERHTESDPPEAEYADGEPYCDQCWLQREYIETVDRESSGYHGGINPGECSACADCRSAFGVDDPAEFEQLQESGKLFNEGEFSWHDCELCRSPLGGNRYAAHGVANDGTIVHYSVCEDCLCYLANSDIPGGL